MSSFQFCWIWIFSCIRLSWHPFCVWDKLEWVICSGSFSVRDYIPLIQKRCYSYSWSCSLCKVGTFFCAGFIPRKPSGFLLKACVHYFLSNFYFFIKWEAFKNHEKRILFHLKSSFRSRDIQISVIFSLPFHTFQIQKGIWKWNNLCHKLICINEQM